MAGRARLPEISSTHLELAAMWTRLAEEAERQSAELEPTEPGRLAGEAPDAGVEA